MPLTQMPNGEYVNVPDDITPEGLAAIKAQYAPQTRKQRVEAGQPRKPTAEEAEVKKRADFREKFNNSGINSILPAFLRPGSDIQRGVDKGLFAGFNDEIAGAAGFVSAIPGAIYHLDPTRMTKEYRIARDTERELDRRAYDRSPVANTVGEVAGAIGNPVGTGAKLVQGAGRLAGAVGLERAAGALGRTAGKMAASKGIGQAALVGGAQGALNAAGNADNLEAVPSAIVNGYGAGALTGGAIGGATHLGGRAIQSFLDAQPNRAAQTAYMRVAELLDNGGMTPKQAQREIAVADARGGDAMVQDLTPGLRAQAASISRRPNVPSSNDLIERGEQRIGARQQAFGDQVRTTAGVPENALSRAENIAGARRAAGQNDYRAGGPMDTQITPTPALQMYLKEAPAEVQDAMRGAYREMLLRDENPANYVGPDGIFTHIPNLRTFDYVKRAFDAKIGQAIRAGDRPTAQGLSYQLDKLKGVLADANPNNAEYQAILSTQRDAFQKENALQIGQKVLSRIGKDPRVVHRELMSLPEELQKEARIGIVDALTNMDSKADPVAFFRSVSRNDAQKRILEFAFGGKGNLGRFQRWVNREVRSTRADVLTAPGRQSETSRIAMAEGDGPTGAGEIFSNALRGYAFGGVPGAVSGASRTLQNLGTGTSRFAQEEIAKILLSKGDTLVKGVNDAKAFARAREIANRRRSRYMGKAGQQLFTDTAGGD